MDFQGIRTLGFDERVKKYITKLIETGGCLLWLFFIIAFFFACSWLSLLNTRVIPEQDTRSMLLADYKPWEYTAFKPVDAAIIEAIEADRGKEYSAFEIAFVEGWLWWTPIPEDYGDPIETSVAGNLSSEPSVTLQPSSPLLTNNSTDQSSSTTTPTPTFTPIATTSETSTTTVTTTVTTSSIHCRSLKWKAPPDQVHLK